MGNTGDARKPGMTADEVAELPVVLVTRKPAASQQIPTPPADSIRVVSVTSGSTLGLVISEVPGARAASSSAEAVAPRLGP